MQIIVMHTDDDDDDFLATCLASANAFSALSSDFDVPGVASDLEADLASVGSSLISLMSAAFSFDSVGAPAMLAIICSCSSAYMTAKHGRTKHQISAKPDIWWRDRKKNFIQLQDHL